MKIKESFIQAVQDKIEYSIRLKLSVKYIRILLAALAGACLGTVVIFGIFTVEEKVSDNYRQIVNILNREITSGQEARDYSEIDQFSRQYRTPVLIFDHEGNLIWGTHPELVKFRPKSWIKIVRQGENIYLVQNRNALITDTPARLVIFSDIKAQLYGIVRFSEIVLVLFIIIFLPAVMAVIQSGQGIFRPIKDTTRTVKHISEKNLNLRLNISGSKDDSKEMR
jgi:methyl-accepting chemotaxis protein